MSHITTPTSRPLAQTGQLPHHISEATFRRFESLIQTAVDNAPAETSFTIPPDLAPTTFLARLRDATLSVKRFGWTTTINMDKLWSLAGTMIWTYDPGQKVVWFREKQRRGRPKEMMSEARSRAQSEAAVIGRWQDVTPDELRALALLITNQRLVGPIIVVGQVDDSDITTLQAEYDIAFVYDPSTNTTIIT